MIRQRHSIRRSTVALAILTGILLPSLARAQGKETFDAFPGGIASLYRFDLARTLFASPQEEERQRQLLSDDYSRFQQTISSTPTPQQLFDALRIADSLELRLNRHYAYLSLRSLLDNRIEQQALREMGAIGAVANRALAPLGQAVSQMTATQLDAAIRAVPSLRVYRFAIERSRPRNMPPVSDSVRALAAAAQPIGYNWGPRRFYELLATIPWGTIDAPEGELDVRSKGSQIVSHWKREVRQAGYRANLRGIESKKDSFALIITETAKARNIVSRSRGFADYRDEGYGERLWSKTDVKRVLEAVANASAINKRYEQLRIDRIRKTFGYSEVMPWDVSAPPPGLVAPRLDIVQATQAILSATASFGPEYVSEMRALLDPKNGRMDIGLAPYRTDRPGFATGVVGYPSFFFQGHYDGFIDDVLILVHEAGHAVQNMLMDRRGVLSRYARGPAYFTESYAKLNELILLEYLYRNAKDQQTRIYYLERLIDQPSDLFRNSIESLFEDRVYGTVDLTSVSAQDLDRMFRETASRFSVWFDRNPELQFGWTRPLQLFTRPLYRVNYTMAELLALNYLQRMKADPRFVTRYQSLLSRGYDAPPDQLLASEMGIDVSNPEVLVRDGLKQMERWIAELEELYRQ